jgi:hypothetical protein
VIEIEHDANDVRLALADSHTRNPAAVQIGKAIARQGLPRACQIEHQAVRVT